MMETAIFTIIGLGVLLYSVRLIFGKFPKNPHFGSRNKFTMSDKEVWVETHKIMGLLLLPAAVAFYIPQALEILGYFMFYHVVYMIPFIIGYLMFVLIFVENFSRKYYKKKHGHTNVRGLKELEHEIILEEEHIVLGIFMGGFMGAILGYFLDVLALTTFLGILVGITMAIAYGIVRKK